MSRTQPAATMRDMQDEIDRLRAGLERLQLPLAFHLPGKADPEHRARMFYAHAILNGESAERAEEIAAENVRRAVHKDEPNS